MFAPTKIWRKWCVRTNVQQKRQAVASALAASAIPSLVQGRGHRIDKVEELPLVVKTDDVQLHKTKDALNLLEKLGLSDEIEAVKNSKRNRAGKGKLRGRKYVMKKGPLIIYKEDEGLLHAFRNIPGIDFCQVSRLNLLQLAPGGHLGRLIIWTSSAFKELDLLWGT